MSLVNRSVVVGLCFILLYCSNSNNIINNNNNKYFISQIRAPGGHDTTFIISTYTINKVKYNINILVYHIKHVFFCPCECKFPGPGYTYNLLIFVLFLCKKLNSMDYSCFNMPLGLSLEGIGV